MSGKNHKLIIAVDNMNQRDAQQSISSISNDCFEYRDRIIFKVNDLVSSIGFQGLQNMFENIPQKIMLDMKWHDISNTLLNHISQIQENKLGESVEYFTIHAANGFRAMKASKEHRDRIGISSKILAVTLLSSFDDIDTLKLYGKTAKDMVLSFTKDALDAGVDGIVCAPQDISTLRSVFGNNFEIITPGVRFEGSPLGDQTRVSTPREAIRFGGDHVVMGRPLLKSNNVSLQVQRFFHEIQNVVASKSAKNHELERLLYDSDWYKILTFIGAFYSRKKGGKYARLASGLLSDSYINIGVSERSYQILQKAAVDGAIQIKQRGIEADIVLGAQMGSVRLSSALGSKLGLKSLYTEKGGENQKEMTLKRHDYNLKGKKVVLVEDVVTRGTTSKQMRTIVEDKGGEVVALMCIANRYGKDTFEGDVPIISCYIPPKFHIYYDEKTPKEVRGSYPKLPEGSQIAEKPKDELFRCV